MKTNEEKWLAYPVQRDEQESIAPLGVLPAMSFTPDSKNVVASYGGKFYSIPVAGGAAVNIPFNMETEMLLGPSVDFKYPIKDDKDMIATQIRDAVVSPDGKQIAFTVLNRLYVAEKSGANPKRVSSFNFTEAMPAWSPDGSQLAWVSWEGNGGNIYKINFKVKGAQPMKLTTVQALYTEPVWSYKNNRIVFMQGASAFFKEDPDPQTFKSQDEIAWISADGGAITLIGKAKGRATPHFTKADDRIYMFHYGKGLISIRWDGTDEKQHLKVSGIMTYGSITGEEHCMLVESATEPQREPSPAGIIRMAPEGDQALAQVKNDVYVITVPKVGAEAPKVSVADASGAAFPSRKLTKFGGEWPTWSPNGRTVYYTLGNALFTYNLDSAKATEDKLKKKKAAEEKAKKEEKKEEKKDPKADSVKNATAKKEDKKDDKKKMKATSPKKFASR